MATLDEKGALTPDPDGDWPSSALVERRRRAMEVLAAQREKLDHLENALPDELQRLAEQIGHDLVQSQVEHLAKQAGEGSQAGAELQLQLDQLHHQLGVRQTELEHLVTELEHARLEAARFEQELRVCQALLEGAHSQSEQRRLEYAAIQEKFDDVQAQLAAAHDRQAELRHQLAEQRELNVVQQEETKAQRRRLARELKAQRAHRLSEEKQHQASLSAATATGEAQLATQLTAARLEVAQARSRLSELGQTLEQRSAELAQERRKGEAFKDQTAQLREALKKAQAERPADNAERARHAEPDVQSQEELRKLRNQCDSLTAKLGDAERKLAESEAKRTENAKSDGDTRKSEDLQRRLEMAVDELREMKQANSELEAKLAKRSDKPAAANGSATGLDWEAQKQRLLASLEADDRDDEEAVAERHTIEGTIRITDEIIAQKDQEITELKRQLAEHKDGSSSPGDPEIAEMLNRDEVIRQERERLIQVQAEWREKIGHAEISISVERAKIARQQAELEEKLRVFQREQQVRAQDGPPGEAGKPPRSRWLARLGLKDLDETS
jgi:chromosome segregation ATPase